MQIAPKQYFDNHLAKKFQMYNFKKHLLIEGDKGVGKTYFVNLWCESNKIQKVMVGGHEQFDSIDFLGHYIPSQNRSLIWKDGALTQAFRIASKGQKVVLVIDEILRIPTRELNILLSTLIPWRGKYTIRTSRALMSEDGVAYEEEISVDTKYLWVVATTNIGKQYNTHNADEAFFDRFRLIKKQTTDLEIQTILKIKIEQKNYSQKTLDTVLRLYNKIKELYKHNELEYTLNLRQLSETIELCHDENQIGEYFLDLIPHICKRGVDGELDTAQNILLTKLIKTYFGL